MTVWRKLVWTLCCAASSDGVVQHDVALPTCSAFHLYETEREGKGYKRVGGGGSWHWRWMKSSRWLIGAWIAPNRRSRRRLHSCRGWLNLKTHLSVWPSIDTKPGFFLQNHRIKNKSADKPFLHSLLKAGVLHLYCPLLFCMKVMKAKRGVIVVLPLSRQQR